MAPARKNAKLLKTVKPPSEKPRRKALKRAVPDEKSDSPESVRKSLLGPFLKKRRKGKQVDHRTDESADDVQHKLMMGEDDRGERSDEHSSDGSRNTDESNSEEDPHLAEMAGSDIKKPESTLNGKHSQFEFAKNLREFTDSRNGNLQRIMLFQVLRRYAARDFDKLSVFYKSKMPEVFDILKRKTSDHLLTVYQAKCAAFMRLTNYTTDNFEEDHVWNIVCAILLRLTLASKEKKEWSAYEMKRDDNHCINRNTDLSALPKNEMRDFKNGFLTSFHEESEKACKDREEMFVQTYVPEGGQNLWIGTLLLKYSKTKRGNNMKAISTTYVTNPRVPYVFASGTKIRRDELERLMRSIDPNYKVLHDMELTDVGLTSLQSVCYAPDSEQVLDLDEIEKVAEEEAKEEAEKNGVGSFNGVKAALKRDKICKKLLRSLTGFAGANKFTTEVRNDSDDDEVCTVTFRSRSGNVAQMIENVCLAGHDPSPYIEARDRKKAKATVLTSKNTDDIFTS